MAKLKPYQIVFLVITLLLMGILLPIGLDEITSYTADNKTDSSTYSAQTILTGANPDRYNITLYEDQEVNCTLEYTDSEDLVNITLYTPSDVEADSDSTANATLTLAYNATAYGVHYLNVSAENVITSATYNLTITITTFIDSDTKDRLESLVGQVIPIVAVIGIIIALVYKKQN